mmetsp:Transcript_10492/g.33217  ORF Transcript_10492/g.33217 Transcript_10492/m.33217 type:complete len:218 (+) Transcript_10492:121-774(+)
MPWSSLVQCEREKPRTMGHRRIDSPSSPTALSRATAAAASEATASSSGCPGERARMRVISGSSVSCHRSTGSARGDAVVAAATALDSTTSRPRPSPARSLEWNSCTSSRTMAEPSTPCRTRNRLRTLPPEADAEMRPERGSEGWPARRASDRRSDVAASAVPPWLSDCDSVPAMRLRRARVTVVREQMAVVRGTRASACAGDDARWERRKDASSQAD